MRTTTFTYRDQPFTFAIAHPRDLIQNYHLNGRFYEQEELLLMEEFMPWGGLFLDVGANVGNHSVWMGRFRAARCVCVEPNPAVLPLLKENLRVNINDGGVIEAGLGKGHETGRGLRTPDEGNLGHTMVEGEGDVCVMPGDALELRPDMVKIDTEGAELDVLAGLEATINLARPVVFVEVMNGNARALGRWAFARGYKLHARHRRYAANENYLLLP